MNSNNRFAAAKKPVSLLRTGRQKINTALTAYAASLESDMEQLHCFRSWAFRKISAQEIETLALRQQLKELLETVRVLSDEVKQRKYGQDVIDTRTGQGVMDTRTITSPVTPVSLAGNRVTDVSSERDQTKRTVHSDDDATKKVV